MGADFDWLYIPKKQKVLKTYKYKGQTKQKEVIKKIETHDDVRKAFESYQDCAAYENGHSYSGMLNMCPGLTFSYEQCKDHDEAEKYILENAQKWENAICIELTDGYLIGGLCSC